ncbi:phage tail tape measure protein [Enterobacter hormaechei subsp. steigerwaltii]|uniref:phage tail tape measure protein n=1 Tax=Citrobacter freundii TaxID=546 RepID=UPI00070C8525|nr:phage tail tape measure protein [Citrobacter freundii]MCU2299249.1 phage tail tape measure protein [Enterobacter hormaechei subsp. steigerwaltii]MCU2321034.1 phage tail tape measure protein [Enterobacter hormaechei subsp. steigerwaltii]MCU2334775.1 phage tail tape measure protein [Enterobacter hormaechei subsp. steigerwaltii]MCU2341994.1 phage tail tape measure protein [Enterobacter hormaechei subsp. steigerwaltii]MCU2383011.1 phage tail tape measure protein [Enterobacter hormaechei subsp. 
MADVASLAVGLHLNAANFKSQLMGAYGDAENSSKRFNRNAQEDAKKTDEAYSRMGKTIAGVAGRLAGFAGAGLSLGAIITTTREYGQALSDLSAITGATGIQLKSLDEAAQEMGRSTEYSASQAVEALKLMASAKPELLQTADGLTEATKSALTLAQAAGSTLPDATRTLALSLNQFGAGAQEADRYINVLAAGAKFGASEIADTAAAIKNGGVAAAQAGVGFETLNAAIQVLAEREIKGGEAGTSLRNVILALEKGTDKTLKPSIVGLSGALENLSKKNLSTAQAVKLFGVENINAASVLVDNRSKLNALTQALTGTQTAHEQAAIRVNNLNGDIMGLTSAFEGMIIKIGQSSTGPLRSGIQSVTDGINLLTDNFNAVANVALYTLIPVISTKLTAGLRESVSAWQQNQAAVKAATAAQADGARKTLESTAATLKRNDAEFGYYRQLEKTARQHGLNVNYQGEFNRLIREETEQTNLATRAKMQLAAANRQVSLTARAASVAVGLARGALALVGGPFGAAMLAGSALLYFHQQAKDARQSAINLKDAVIETTAALMQMSDKQLAVKQIDLQDQYENQVTQRNQLIKEIQDADSRLDSLGGFDPFRQKKGVEDSKKRAEADLEAVNKGLETTQSNLENVSKARFLVQTGIADQAKSLANDIKNITAQTAKAGEGVTTPWTGEDTQKARKETVNQYLQLRREIEEAHATSLGKIDLQEKASQEKLIAAARKNGASQQDLQRALLMNAENYQKQRNELAEQYSPARSAINKEKEASQELKSLLDARLLTEKEYMAARVTLSQETSRQILQAQANALSAPRLELAGDVDPLAQQRNQLVQQQSLVETYYRNGVLSKQQYEMLMQKSSKDSADAQYQTALELYRSQSDFNNLAIGLVDATRERTTNVLTGLLTNTQTFKEGMINLFSTLTQSIIQNLVDMAAQALVTNTILSSIMGVGSSVLGGVSGSTAGSSGTAIADYGSNFQFNAKGGVYSSSDLSAYSGQVVDNPTFFAFAKGAGVMGEAGPEAIMPLTRAADGSLGVRAVSGGASEGAAPQVFITINGDGSTASQSSGGLEKFGKSVGNFVRDEYRKLIQADLRPGGAIWNSTNGRR